MQPPGRLRVWLKGTAWLHYTAIYFLKTLFQNHLGNSTSYLGLTSWGKGLYQKKSDLTPTWPLNSVRVCDGDLKPGDWPSYVNSGFITGSSRLESILWLCCLEHTCCLEAGLWKDRSLSWKAKQSVLDNILQLPPVPCEMDTKAFWSGPAKRQMFWYVYVQTVVDVPAVTWKGGWSFWK